MKSARMVRAELARRELARRHFRDYLRYVHGAAWIETAMSRYLADRVQAFLEADTGHTFDVLLIETPPQHGKSMTVTEALPSWRLGADPDARIILAAYNDELAERFLRRNREKLQRFGDTLFGVSVGGLNRASALELHGHRGGMIARGVRSGITGNPADLILIDDPVKSREEADSDVWRAKVWEEWQNSLKTRLAAGAKVIVIMTPWHEDDLAGRLLRAEKNVTLLRLPVAAEEKDPLGRKPGAALCPELGKGDRWLRDFRRSYVSDPRGGARAWAALYQCAPRVEDGNLIRRGWWRYYDPAAVRDFSAEVISVDAAFMGTERSDFVAITVWGKRGNDYYLRCVVNRQMGFSDTLRAIRETAARFPSARRVLIEDKANGPAILEVLRRELFCVPVDPKGGKVARVNAVSPAIESGHVFLPEGLPGLETFLDQWTAFPNAPHDDMVDSSTQALSFLLSAPGESTDASEPDEEAEFTAAELYDVYG
ncbi:MAG: phage terminase large subunit [Oscillospiraceae bacterium]|nr:phage terminase large subunit [Oscillospiraceae bacterium]